MRIVSLLASATEMIAALGCLHELVGRSHECDYPSEVLQLPLLSTVQINTQLSSAKIDAQIKQLVRQKEAVQNDAIKALSIYAIDLALLQRLQPDVIFTQTQCEVCAVSEKDVQQALSQTIGLHPRIVSLTPYQLQDVWEDMLRVGAALERQQQAKDLVEQYQQRLKGLQERVRACSPNQHKPRVAILEWLDPLMGAGNWIPELITYAGGVPVFGEVGMHSPWLNWEELQQADPEVLILSPCGFSLERTLDELPHLRNHPAWQQLKAVRQKRVYIVNGNDYLNRSGPRLVDSAEILAQIIWGLQSTTRTEQTAWLEIP